MTKYKFAKDLVYSVRYDGSRVWRLDVYNKWVEIGDAKAFDKVRFALDRFKTKDEEVGEVTGEVTGEVMAATIGTMGDVEISDNDILSRKGVTNAYPTNVNFFYKALEKNHKAVTET